MTVRVTAAQARALGLGKQPAKKARTAIPVRKCAPNRCCTCGEVFTTEAGERRHADTLRHHRFEMVMDIPTPG